MRARGSVLHECGQSRFRPSSLHPKRNPIRMNPVDQVTAGGSLRGLLTGRCMCSGMTTYLLTTEAYRNRMCSRADSKRSRAAAVPRYYQPVITTGRQEMLFAGLLVMARPLGHFETVYSGGWKKTEGQESCSSESGNPNPGHPRSR
jgi:hypothetical protein